MGKGRGLGGLIALIGLVLILSRDENGEPLPWTPLPWAPPPTVTPLPPLTAADFAETFISGPTVYVNGPPGPAAAAITYKRYVTYVTKPEEELEESEAFVESVTTSGRVGRWLTVNGLIPTPGGELIPVPTIHVGRIDVSKMLEPIGEEKPEQYFADVEFNGKIRRSVSARLQPV